MASRRSRIPVFDHRAQRNKQRYGRYSERRSRLLFWLRQREVLPALRLWMRGKQMTTESKSTLLHFTTGAFGPAKKVAAWREIYGRQFVSTNFEPEARDSFKAEATLRAYQGLGIGSIRMRCSRFYRIRERINRTICIWS